MTCESYVATLTEDPDGGFVVTFRDFPEAITQGDDVAESLSEAADCLAEAIAARIDEQLEVPAASALLEGEYLVPVPSSVFCKATTIGKATRKLGFAKTQSDET